MMTRWLHFQIIRISNIIPSSNTKPKNKHHKIHKQNTVSAKGKKSKSQIHNHAKQINRFPAIHVTQSRECTTTHDNSKQENCADKAYEKVRLAIEIELLNEIMNTFAVFPVYSPDYFTFAKVRTIAFFPKVLSRGLVVCSAFVDRMLF